MRTPVVLLALLWASPSEAAVRIIHLFGDSISRGYALGGFAETILPSNPLYVFRSPWAMGNAVLEANGAPYRMVFHSVGSVELADPTGLHMSDVIAAAVADGGVTAGDVVVIEDAGAHSQNPDTYQAALTSAVTAASAPGVKVIVMTMFDYSPAATNMQWSTPFVGSSGVTRTMNAAIIAGAGSATLVDMKAAMDGYKAYAIGQVNGPVMQADGVHPNIYGQALFAGEVLKAAGARPWLSYVDNNSVDQPKLNAITEVAHVNYQSIRYGAQFWGDSWPAELLRVALLR
jgi:hypothetical protein